MINLYDKNCTSFNNNGLVVLSDCKSCFIEEKLNDSYELTLEYPIDDRGKWQYLTEGNIIKADGQLFRIYHKQKTLDGIQINARHIFYDLLDNFVESCNIQNTNAAGTIDDILTATQYSHPFTSMSDVTGLNSINVIAQNPVEAIMNKGGVIDLYGGELVRDNFTIKLLQARGLDRGVLISYGKNIQGINEDIDLDSVITRIYPTGKDGLILTEKYVDSPYINNYPHPKIKPIAFDDIETEDALRIAAQSYFTNTKCDIPLANYKIDFLELTKTEEYKNYSILESVYMGDTVTVKHTKLNINLKCKVIRIKKNILTNRIEEVELGSFKPSLADSINDTADAINSITDGKGGLNLTALANAIKNATNLIISGNEGHVIQDENGISIMDTTDKTTAVKVWRWNLNGLGYSSTGWNGPYTTAITADGKIVADFITVGVLDGTLLKAGTVNADTVKSTWVYAGNINASQIASGKVTASQIDATNLHVNSANIDGTIVADTVRAGELDGVTIKTANTTNYMTLQNQFLSCYNNLTELVKIGYYQFTTGYMYPAAEFHMPDGTYGWIAKQGDTLDVRNATGNSFCDMFDNGQVSIGTVGGSSYINLLGTVLNNGYQMATQEWVQDNFGSSASVTAKFA